MPIGDKSIRELTRWRLDFTILIFTKRKIELIVYCTMFFGVFDGSLEALSLASILTLFSAINMAYFPHN